MPNMFGGDQSHPAYDPCTTLEKNQVMDGNTLYTILKDGVEFEHVTGERGSFPLDSPLAPKTVKQKIEELKEESGD